MELETIPFDDWINLDGPIWSTSWTEKNFINGTYFSRTPIHSVPHGLKLNLATVQKLVILVFLSYKQ